MQGLLLLCTKQSLIYSVIHYEKDNLWSHLQRNMNLFQYKLWSRKSIFSLYLPIFNKINKNGFIKILYQWKEYVQTNSCIFLSIQKSQ